MSSTPPNGTLGERQKTALSDLSSLGRVSHRIAMTDAGPPLQKVLMLLLPRLLQRIGSNHEKQQELKKVTMAKSLQETYDKIHAKLVEMLSHTMKRVRADHDCKLPCQAVLNLLLVYGTTEKDSPQKSFVPKEKVDPFTMNLALAFLTLGLPRCTSEEVEALIPGLLVLVGHYSGVSTLKTASRKAQSHQLHHLLLRAIEASVVSTAPSPDSNAQMEIARHVVQNPKTGGAVYDLIMDVLLYQPVPGLGSVTTAAMPPQGLSQAGNERLLGGASQTAKNWGAEMAPATRLKDLKMALLDYIAPCRRWALFMKDNDNNGQGNGGGDTSEEINNVNNDESLGVTRTVALLVVASGDAHVNVSERATSYLKAHLDSMRQRSSVTSATAALGSHPLLLASALISLVLGESNAEAAVKRMNSDIPILSLGIQVDPNDTADTTLFLSTKRRMTSDKTSCAILNFVATRILDENPQLLDLSQTNIVAFASLTITACHNLLLSTSNNNNSMRASNSPYVAAAKLLNSVTVRLASHYDNTMSNKNDSLVGLLSRSLSIACSVLAGASSSGSTSTSEGMMATRDACYGVVCTLSRSRFAVARQGGIFSCGGGSTTMSKTTTTSMAVSIETAALLFGCASNEVETLRPRAVAALDALLGAYCRVYNKDRTVSPTLPTVSDTQSSVDMSTAANPWSQPTTASSTTPNQAEYAANNKKSLSKSLLPLLWTASQSSQPKASRVAAARWSTELLKLLDLSNACHILCFLTGDADVTASNIAREGLGLLDSQQDESSAKNALPDFSDLTAVLFDSNMSNSKQSSSSWRPQYFDFTHKGKAGAVQFGLKCLYNDLYGGEDEAVETYVSALTQSLSWFSTSNQAASTGRESIDLLDECSVCLAGCFSTSKFARSMVVSHGKSFGLEDMEALAISADSSKARRYLAEACGHVYKDYGLWCNTGGPCDLLDWVQNCQITRAMEVCARKLNDMQSNLFMAGEVHGAAFLGARCVRAFRLLAATQSGEESEQSLVNACWGFSETILSALGRGTLHSDEVLGNACSNGLVIALSYDGVDAPILDKHLYSGSATALSNLNTSLRRYGNGDHTDPTRATLLAEATGMVLAATTSGAGYVSSGANEHADLGPARIQCLDALFSILGSSSFRKDPDIALVTGEALALYSDAFSPAGAVWTFAPTEWPEDYDESYANELPPHQQVLYLLLRREINSSSPHKRTACATALLALAGRAAKMVNGNGALAKRAFVRELLARLGDVQAAFISLLAYPKSKQLARESCCLGLAACQGLADAAAVAGDNKVQDEIVSRGLNDRLLKAFGQTTNYGGSAMMETRSQEAERRRGNRDTGNAETSATSMMESFGMETEVGGASGMGEAALGAYREMASAAMALGRPDVLYALMLLSVSHPVWFSEGPRDRYSAASLLGENSIVGNRTNAAEIRDALRPHLQALIPRLLRACNDPNKQTREQMGALWVGLTGGGAESRLAITQHLLPTIDVLIEDASNKLWRARVGACGALTEVIVGRSWDDLGGGGPVLNDDDVLSPAQGAASTAAIRLLRLWRAATRALDDVRLSVRESGESLSRSVRSLTIRLCDPRAMQKSAEESTGFVNSETKAKIEYDTSAAAATALRWLVKHGLNQACAEATGACVSCLLGIIDVVQPTQLQPVLPELVGSLLMAMSGLEPAALNYLQVRTAGQDSAASAGGAYDRLERMRLQLAQSGPIAGALTKCLDMMRSIDVEAQKAVIPQLDSALRCGAGFATRAAAADAVSSLCTTCPAAFKFPGQSSTNPTVRLLRALYFASERERGPGARDKMAHALGNLADLSPGPSVRSLALRACERYSQAQGNNDDPAARRAAAAALRAMAVRATPQFADGGANDIWCRRVLPIAFLGQRDPDGKVASLWKEVWDEGGSAANVSARRSGRSDDFGVLLEEKLLPYLVRACVEALEDVSWSRRIAGCAALAELSDLNVLAPAPRSVEPTIQRNEETPNMTRARRRAKASNAALRACVKLIVKSRIWAGKSEVVKASVKVAGQWSSVGIGEEVNCSVFGWDGNAQVCPWAPLLLASNQGADDLFLGDRWFQEDHQVVEETESTSNVDRRTTSNGEKANVDKQDEATEESSKIDFEDCDKLLGDESAPSSTEEDDDAVLKDSSKVLTFSGFCRALLEQGMPTAMRQSLASSPDDILPYRAAALQGLGNLLNSLNSSSGGTSQLRNTYRMVSTTLIGVIDSENIFGLDGSSRSQQPPLIVARSIDCLSAAMWKGIGGEQASQGSDKFESALELARFFRASGGEKQPAWTVRESAALGAASLAAQCGLRALRKHDTISVLLECTVQAMKDRKFWRVRYAGLKLLHTLVCRAGSTNDNSTAFSITGSSVRETNACSLDRQLLLEALLPHKEKILKIARSSLADSEVKVTSIGTDVCGAMAWWP